MTLTIIITTIVPILGCAAYYALGKRKISAHVQKKSENVVDENIVSTELVSIRREVSSSSSSNTEIQVNDTPLSNVNIQISVPRQKDPKIVRMASDAFQLEHVVLTNKSLPRANHTNVISNDDTNILSTELVPIRREVTSNPIILGTMTFDKLKSLIYENTDQDCLKMNNLNTLYNDLKTEHSMATLVLTNSIRTASAIENEILNLARTSTTFKSQMGSPSFWYRDRLRMLVKNVKLAFARYYFLYNHYGDMTEVDRVDATRRLAEEEFLKYITFYLCVNKEAAVNNMRTEWTAAFADRSRIWQDNRHAIKNTQNWPSILSLVRQEVSIHNIPISDDLETDCVFRVENEIYRRVDKYIIDKEYRLQYGDSIKNHFMLCSNRASTLMEPILALDSRIRLLQTNSNAGQELLQVKRQYDVYLNSLNGLYVSLNSSYRTILKYWQLAIEINEHISEIVDDHEMIKLHTFKNQFCAVYEINDQNAQNYILKLFAMDSFEHRVNSNNATFKRLLAETSIKYTKDQLISASFKHLRLAFPQDDDLYNYVKTISFTKNIVDKRTVDKLRSKQQNIRSELAETSHSTFDNLFNIVSYLNIDYVINEVNTLGSIILETNEVAFQVSMNQDLVIPIKRIGTLAKTPILLITKDCNLAIDNRTCLIHAINQNFFSVIFRNTKKIDSLLERPLRIPKECTSGFNAAPTNSGSVMGPGVHNLLNIHRYNAERLKNLKVVLSGISLDSNRKSQEFKFLYLRSTQYRLIQHDRQTPLFDSWSFHMQSPEDVGAAVTVGAGLVALIFNI